MQKVVNFLEKYVQWIALGIGALYLGLMAYSYLVEPAVQVEYAGKQRAPGEIDPAIAAGPAKGLKDAMANRDLFVSPPFEPRDEIAKVIGGGGPVPLNPTDVRPP